MPKMTVYIRDADLDLWLALENKSQAISDLLNGLQPPKRVEALKTRTKAEILEDVSNVEADRDERLAFCQDLEERKKINDEAKNRLNELWAEYHSLEKPLTD